jgi:hypothetical protein
MHASPLNLLAPRFNSYLVLQVLLFLFLLLLSLSLLRLLRLFLVVEVRH